jgi:xylulokinase
MALLGIDIGSTALRAAAFDARGQQIALVRLKYRGRVPDAVSWWRTSARAARDLVERLPPGVEIEAIGLSGRAGTRVFLDRRNRPVHVPDLAPSVSSLARAKELAGPVHGSHGLTFLAKLIELRRSDAQAIDGVARALVAKDYVLYRLIGRFITDPASSLQPGSWPRGVLEAPELRGIELSEVAWPWERAGALSQDAARRMGLPAGLPVAVGGHDGASATLGVGASKPGAHSITLGTNSVYRIVSEEARRTADRFWEMLPGQTVYGADIRMGGYAVDWIGELLGKPHRQLEREAEEVPPGCEGLVFLPQLGGRMLPRPDPDATGAFLGLREGHGHAHLYRAVLEGNAYALRSARETLLADGDLPDGDVYLTGAGAVSPLWRQIIADVLQKPMHWSGIEDGCRAAAMFGAVASGLYESIEAAITAMTGPCLETEPSEAAALYEAAYQRFLAFRDSIG